MNIKKNMYVKFSLADFMPSFSSVERLFQRAHLSTGAQWEVQQGMALGHLAVGGCVDWGDLIW